MIAPMTMAYETNDRRFVLFNWGSRFNIPPLSNTWAWSTETRKHSYGDPLDLIQLTMIAAIGKLPTDADGWFFEAGRDSKHSG
jgi:hypothetical protein